MTLSTLLGRRAFVLALPLALALPTAAQDGPSGPEVRLPSGVVMQAGSFEACRLPAFHPDMLRTEGGHVPTPSSYDPSAPFTATFEVTYSGFSVEAQAAFQRAVDIWSQHLVSSVPIKVQANWTPLGTNVLGSANTTALFRNLPGQPLANSWYPSALADAISGVDQWTVAGQPNQVDMQTRFSSNFTNWYYGLDGNTPGGSFDLVTVVLHELGHGLGFTGSAQVTSQGIGTHSQGGLPYAYDRWVEDVDGVPMLNGSVYPNNSAELAAFLQSSAPGTGTGGNVFFDGLYTRPTLGADTGLPPRLYSPAQWDQGSSYSHFNDRAFAADNPNALMTPFVEGGESHDAPGPITCALFKDIGWPLSELCEAVIVPPDSSTAAEDGPGLPLVSLEAAGPNPFAQTTALRLVVEQPQAVRAELYDVVGRQVATLFEGPVAAGVPTEFEVRGAGLTPGLYVVRVTGETFTAAQRVTYSD